MLHGNDIIMIPDRGQVRRGNRGEYQFHLQKNRGMCIQETFVDAVRLSGLEELAASHGIFPRDPTLKDFLREKPACLVTLRCIWNYARSRTAEQCRDVLEKYVVRGGDGG